MISKELLSEVLEVHIYNFKQENNKVIYNNNGEYTACPSCGFKIKESSACARTWHCSNKECEDSGSFEFSPPSYNNYDRNTINIYELAHKCKEWSLSKGYAIESCLEHKTSIAAIISVDSDNPLFGTKHYYISDTEPEAIFKACEWIMEQIK